MHKYRFTLNTGDKVEAELPMEMEAISVYMNQPVKDQPMVVTSGTKAFVMSAVVMVEDITERPHITITDITHRHGYYAPGFRVQGLLNLSRDRGVN